MKDVIKEKLEQFVNNREIAGAVIKVRQHGKLVYDGAVGWMNLETKESVRGETIFRLASMSKPVGAIAVLQLIEEGKLGLYDKVSKYLPEYKDCKVCARNISQEEYQPDPENPTNAGVLEEIR